MARIFSAAKAGTPCDFSSDGGNHKAKYTVTGEGRFSTACAKHLPNAYAAVGSKAPWTHHSQPKDVTPT